MRALSGSSNVMSAEESATNACALRTSVGILAASPGAGLLRRSRIIPSRTGPNSVNTSPAAILGVRAVFDPVFAKVSSSKWLTEEPASYVAGVNRSGLTPLLALIPSGPDQTNLLVNAFANSTERDGKSAKRFPSSVCE